MKKIFTSGGRSFGYFVKIAAFVLVLSSFGFFVSYAQAVGPSDSTISSSLYAISSTSSTAEIISGVLDGTPRGVFESFLVKGDPSQTWDDSQISNPLVNSTSTSLYALIVTSPDGTASTTYIVTMKPRILSSISVSTSSAKLNYNIGEAFDFSGLVVTGTYSDYSSSTGILSIDGSNIQGFDNSKVGTEQIVVNVGGVLSQPFSIVVSSNDSTLVSSTYNVISTSSSTGIIDVPQGTSSSTLLAGLTFNFGQNNLPLLNQNSCPVAPAPGTFPCVDLQNSKLSDPILVNGDTLITFAQDGTTSTTYTISVVPTPISISNVTPVDNSFVNAGLIMGYTLNDEVATAGTISFNQTSGATDTVVHVYTLNASDMATGTHTLTLSDLVSNASSAFGNLVDGAVYSINFSVSDGLNNVYKKNIKNVTYDETAPVITLNGSSEETVYSGSVYSDAGAVANDNVDGTFAANVTGSVDTNNQGTYILTYSASDKAGNKASSITRTVTVVRRSSGGFAYGGGGSNGGGTVTTNIKTTVATLTTPAVGVKKEIVSEKTTNTETIKSPVVVTEKKVGPGSSVPKITEEIVASATTTSLETAQIEAQAGGTSRGVNKRAVALAVVGIGALALIGYRAFDLKKTK